MSREEGNGKYLLVTPCPVKLEEESIKVLACQSVNTSWRQDIYSKIIFTNKRRLNNGEK